MLIPTNEWYRSVQRRYLLESHKLAPAAFRVLLEWTGDDHAIPFSDLRDFESAIGWEGGRGELARILINSGLITHCADPQEMPLYVARNPSLYGPEVVAQDDERGLQ